MKIIINEIPPSDNKFKGRQNVWEYRIEKERWLGVVWYACVGRKPSEPFKKATVTITYFFPTRGRSCLLYTSTKLYNFEGMLEQVKK